MATYNVTGIAISGTVSEGTLQYEGPISLTAVVPDTYLLTFTYQNPFSGASTNDFGIPEIETDASLFYDLSIDVEFDDELYVYDLNFGSGQTMRILQYYVAAIAQDYLFAIGSTGGMSTDLPTTQADVSALAGMLDPNQPALLVDEPAGQPFGAALDLATWANTTFTNDDLFFDDVGNSGTFNLGVGDDSAYVRDGNDVVDAGAGADRVVATGGTNDFQGGSGNDILRFKGDANGTLRGGDDDDRLYGAAGSDTLSGDAGVDQVFGLDGNDMLNGGTDGDFLYGGRGDDMVYGGLGDDVLRGNRNNDALFGEDGADRLFGGGNNDALSGGAGDDFLLGEGGNDSLDGGDGDDTLTGGSGVDAFVMSVGGGSDSVKDFEDGIDQIDMTNLELGFEDVTIAARSWGTRVDFSSGEQMLLLGVDAANIDSADFFGFF